MICFLEFGFDARHVFTHNGRLHVRVFVCFYSCVCVWVWVGGRGVTSIVITCFNPFRAQCLQFFFFLELNGHHFILN